MVEHNIRNHYTLKNKVLHLIALVPTPMLRCKWVNFEVGIHEDEIDIITLFLKI